MCLFVCRCVGVKCVRRVLRVFCFSPFFPIGLKGALAAPPLKHFFGAAISNLLKSETTSALLSRWASSVRPFGLFCPSVSQPALLCAQRQLDDTGSDRRRRGRRRRRRKRSSQVARPLYPPQNGFSVISVQPPPALPSTPLQSETAHTHPHISPSVPKKKIHRTRAI